MHGRLRVFLWTLVSIHVAMFSSCKRQPRGGKVSRIISLSPSLTQMVFSLGAGEKIRAVTKYDYRPHSVQTLPKVGGFLDIDLETLLSHKPDLVLLTEMHSQIANSLKGAGVEYMELRTRSIAEVMVAITRLAGRLGLPGRGRELRENLSRALTPVPCGHRPRVLITLGRNKGSLKNLVGAGPGTYLHELLLRAGGINALKGGVASYPRLSEEELVGFDPQVVLDLVPPGYSMEPWRSVSFQGKVRIELLTDKTASSPGVHMGETLKLIHSLICRP
ncbi:ABC transporter substrate-binding protein [Myxococcota bacterium]|nr:ABC transporter substrate-binding protein [Myxococcota bacterium]